MKYVTRTELIQMIKSTKGRIFSLYFIKRGDGQIRRMNATTAIAKHLTGTGKPVSAAAKLIVVTDLQKRAIRSIPHEGILEATIGGEVYKVR